MDETSRQYVRRMLRLIAGRDPLAVMRASPARLARLTRGLTRAELHRRPAPGKWSIAEIVAHLADSELVIGHRFRIVFAATGAPMANYDQDFWAARGIYARQRVRDSLAEFTLLRRKNLRLLGLMPRGLWRNYGRHELRGRESIRRIVQLYAGHDLNHLQQVAAIRRGRGTRLKHEG